MKYLDAVARTATAPAFYILILTTPIFLTSCAERHELPWVKRCVDLTPDLWSDSNPETKEAILRGIAAGDIWLNKIKYDKMETEFRSNVCLEVYLPSRGTCLLQHINLSACRIGDIRPAFREGMSRTVRAPWQDRCWRIWRISCTRYRQASWTRMLRSS